MILTPETLLIAVTSVFVGLCVGFGVGVGNYVSSSLFNKRYEDKELDLSL
jgi:uncharacterized protein YneF (UPF0154 family)